MKTHRPTIPYEKLVPGMIGEVQKGQLVVLIRKGTVHELKDFFIGGQCGMKDVMMDAEMMGIPDESLNEAFAYIELSTEEGMDFNPGDSYVGYYGEIINFYTSYPVNNVLLRLNQR